MAESKNTYASKKKKEILVFGKKDPRGYDNKIEIWIDDEGFLQG